MKVFVAESSGFCPGVRNAISIAEKVLNENEQVSCLGPIIHNKDMVNKLSQEGLTTVQNPDEITSGTVLIRSHGASPQQISQLKSKGVKLVDATCVLVKRVQQIAARLAREGYFVVVVGDRRHPEVKAVKGCVKNGDVVVIAGESEVDQVPKNKPLGIISQTTQGPQQLARTISAIASEDFSEMKIINTLCRETIKRQRSAVKLCKEVDVMFVLGGLNSANTKKLVDLCKKCNNNTFHLQNWNEFDKKLVSGCKTAGVTAGASTPDWIIEQFVENLKKI